MRFPFCATLFAILLANPATADDKPKPNTLTPKEIADGWLLLFDGETTFGWKIDGAAEVKDGALLLGKKTVAWPTASFGTYTISFQYQGKGAVVTGTEPDSVVPLSSGEGEWADAEFTRHAPAKRLEKLGHALVPVVFLTEENPIRIRSVKLRPTKANSLFDGKNLDGWKVNAADPKRMASKFEVTKEAELSVKNGPGDLVTEKEFDNFVLQFECKTLGDGLNSGFFFRCIPGQYQNGYEAQVQNSYLDKDRTKPKDFGTGAIYRRIASRKVVSNDNEWFTMTVVADGKHIATWVNGYQTVYWTDDRPADENPRKGYRATKGPISIQGHDPTTDLLFRNIRVGELPK